MSNRVVQYFRNSPTAGIITVGLLIVGAFYAARLYYVDVPKLEQKAESQAGAERLEAMADALEEYIGAEGKAAAASLPARTDWYPRELPCAGEVAFGAADSPIWATMKVEADETTAFQYRFEYLEDHFVLRARRDSDCDGLYAVWVLEGRTDWSALLGRTTSAQNVRE